MILLFSSITFPPFYSVNLESRGNIDSPVLLPVYQSLFCAHHLEGWAFPCFSYFLPFDDVSSKAMADFSISECAWCHVPYDSPFGRPSFLSFFLSGWNPTLLVRKFFAATSFFIALYSDSPRYRSFVLWEVTLGFLLFLLDLWYLRRTHLPSVSCVLLAFPSSYLNPLLAMLHASGIPSFWQPLGILTQLSFYTGSSPIFWSGLLFFFFFLFS